jgi:hypothetical protein
LSGDDGECVPVTNPADRKRSQEQLELLRALLAENASIDDDVLDVGNNTWMLHGVMPYDGEEPMAVFDSREEAQRMLDEVRDLPRFDERE